MEDSIRYRLVKNKGFTISPLLWFDSAEQMVLQDVREVEERDADGEISRVVVVLKTDTGAPVEARIPVSVDDKRRGDGAALEEIFGEPIGSVSAAKTRLPHDVLVETTSKPVASKEGNTETADPIVGVILMVAVTVILASVAGIFVIDIADTTTSGSASVTFEDHPDGVTIQYINSQNVDSVIVSDEYGELAQLDSLGQTVTLPVSPGTRLTVDAVNTDGERIPIQAYRYN